MVESYHQLKRRSKSLDDLSMDAIQDLHHLCPRNDISTPASPFVSWTTPLPKRRHSTCIEAGTKGNLGLATVYGWMATTTSNRQKILPKHLSRAPCLHKRSLQSSRSFSYSVASHRLTRVLCRRKSLTMTPQSASFPSLATLTYPSFPHTKGIVSAIIAAAHLPESEPLGWVGVEETGAKEGTYTDTLTTVSSSMSSFSAAASSSIDTDAIPPPPPIESDPHVFDLVRYDSPHLIHYSRREVCPTISSATVEKLVEKLTRELDSDFLLDFFLTFRHFLTPIKLCKLLMLRFRWALLQDNDERRLVRIRTFVVIRHWLTHYWAHDFVPSRTLRFMLCTFLSQLRTHPVVVASPRDERIIKNLRTVLKRQRQLHSQDEEDSITTARSSFLSVTTPEEPSIWKKSGASRTLPKLQHGRNARKDSAIGLTHTSTVRDLRSSTSASTLPFLARSRRLSTASQRGVHEGSAWAAKVNFSIKTIKRSVPSMYQSLRRHGHPQSLPQHTHSGVEESCLCDASQVTGDASMTGTQKPKTISLVRSASRIFDSKVRRSGDTFPRPSISTPTQGASCDAVGHLAESLHSNPLCPMHTAPNTPSPKASPIPTTPRALLRRKASFFGSPESTQVFKPLVLRYRSEIIAQQFCIIEQEMLQKVTWDELVELRWRKRKASLDGVEETNEDQDGGVELLIGFFNKTCQWVASQIVQTQSLETRIRVIEKFIRIALKCYHHRNYSTLMQILLGLQSPGVSRLERTWQRIDHYEMQIFGELKEMAKPFRNWKNVRECMSKAMEDVAESSAVENILTQSRTPPNLLNGRGCIPFLGLYLSDLVFNAELPTYLDRESIRVDEDISVSPRASADPCDAALNDRLSAHLVNYNRFRITASVIKHVLAFQVLSRAYRFSVHPELYIRLQQMSYLDNAEIRTASFLCEE